MHNVCISESIFVIYAQCILLANISMHNCIFIAFIIRFIKELPEDRRTGYHDKEEGECMHSVCIFFTSYKASRFMGKTIVATHQSYSQRAIFVELVKESTFSGMIHELFEYFSLFTPSPWTSSLYFILAWCFNSEYLEGVLEIFALP